MAKTKRLFLDQFGRRFYAHTVKELREQIPGAISIMYIDRGGKTLRTGYVIGAHWLNEYAAVERPA